MILGLLAREESYGYAIMQEVRKLSSDRIRWTDGMLYPVLHWLEDQDYVRSEWRDAESGRKRKYYLLKAPGKRALRE